MFFTMFILVISHFFFILVHFYFSHKFYTIFHLITKIWIFYHCWSWKFSITIYKLQIIFLFDFIYLEIFFYWLTSILDRVDEVGRRQMGLPHQSPRKIITTHSSGTRAFGREFVHVSYRQGWRIVYSGREGYYRKIHPVWSESRMKSMMSFPRSVHWFLSVSFFLAFAGGVNAADPLDAPQQVIQQTANQLQVSLQKPEYKGNFAKATTLVDQIINPHVDFDRVSMLVLGKNFKTATQDQRDRFKKEFRLLLVRTYTTAFTEYSDWKINYLPLEGDGNDKKVMVKTEILQSGGKPVAVNYRMIQDGAEWKVYDILIEGVSLLQNYRTSFNDQIEQGETIDQLIGNLAERNASALSDPEGAKKEGL